MSGEIHDPYQQILEAHDPSSRVIAPGGLEMTLDQALQFEARWCNPKSEERRSDTQIRAGKLAIMLRDGGSLRDEFADFPNLIPPPAPS